MTSNPAEGPPNLAACALTRVALIQQGKELGFGLAQMRAMLDTSELLCVHDRVSVGANPVAVDGARARSRYAGRKQRWFSGRDSRIAEPSMTWHSAIHGHRAQPDLVVAGDHAGLHRTEPIRATDRVQVCEPTCRSAAEASPARASLVSGRAGGVPDLAPGRPVPP